MFYSICVYSVMFILSLFGLWEYEKSIDMEIAQNKKTVINFSKLKKLIWFLLFFLPPIIVATYRNVTVGTDYMSYVEMYKTIGRYSFLDYMELKGVTVINIEPGYQLVNRFVYRFFDNFIYVNCINQLLIMFFMWRGLVYYHKEYKISMVFSMFLFYMLEFSSCFNGMRFMIAVAIFFYGLKFLMEKKLVHYVLVCLLAMSFHQMLVIALPLYLVNILSHKGIRKWAKFVVLAAMIFVIFNIDYMLKLMSSASVFSKYFDFYAIDYNVSYGTGIWIMSALLMFPNIIFWDRIVYGSEKMQSLLICSLIYLPLRFLGYYNTWMGRMTVIPEVCFFVLIPFLVVSNHKPVNKKLISTYYVAYGLISYIVQFVILKYSEVYPFSWIQLGGRGL